MAHAIIDPFKAYKEALQLPKYDNTTSKSTTLYWIVTRPEMMLHEQSTIETRIPSTTHKVSITGFQDKNQTIQNMTTLRINTSQVQKTKFCFEHGIDYIDNDLQKGHYVSTSSAAGCQKACQTTIGCNY